MADTRELIMARLVTLLGTLAGVDEVLRNQIVLDDEDGKTRRIIILEGDETPADDEQGPKRRPAIAPRIIQMQPQILLSNFAGAGDVGSGLSAIRAAVIKAIAADAALIALTYDGTGGHYLGLSSDLAFAQAMSGETALKFRFTYVLRPAEL
jgi:hypothetical protein